MSIFLTLGGVQLEAFEIPARLKFGGRQSLAVHEMPGGARVIDAMGRSDDALSWEGVFSGPDATLRARTLDAMRVAGNALILSWDCFCYDVVIARLHMEYTNPWWIPYQVSCVVAQDLAQYTPISALSAAAQILSDLTAAGSFFNVSSALAATGLSDALTIGTADRTSAAQVLARSAASLAGSLAAAQAGLGSRDIGAIVSSAGSLAQLASAQAYLARATMIFSSSGN